MSLYKDASLVMIPSAVKDGKLYSIRPTDGDGDFTFSRGSNLAATRVDVNGLIEKGRENLLVQSNTFNNGSWYSGGLSETSGQSGYNGTNDAWLIEALATGTRFLEQNISSGVNTLSVYAKAGTTNWIMLNDGGGSSAYFDIANGVLGSNSGADYIDHSIESIGSSWYRCSLTSVNISQARIYLAAADGNLSNSIGNNIYIQDAQLEQGLVATDYIETGASTAQAGILEDLPRLDYSGGASCPALLLEPQRSNLVTHSEYGKGFFTQANASGVIGLGSLTTPEGVVNGFRIYESTNNNYQNRIGSISYTAGTAYTFSLFAKATDSVEKIILFGQQTTQPLAWFNLVEGSVYQETNSSASIEDYGNGWYRCIMTWTAAATQTSQLGINLIKLGTDFTNQYVGNTSNFGEFYGAQLEAGSYPTSYIPTMGSAVTRSGDLPKVTGVSDLIGQTEGTLFAEVDFNGVNESISQTSIFIRTSGVNTGYIFINFYQGKLNCGLRVAGSTLFDSFQTGVLSEGRYKIAFAYKSGDIAIYVNGVQEETRTNTFGTTSYADIHLSGVSGNQLGDKHHQALVFKTRLTNAELAALTTI